MQRLPPLKSRVTTTHCRIPSNVKFLVVAGNIFTRYHTTPVPFTLLLLKDNNKYEAVSIVLTLPPKPATPVTAKERKAVLLTFKIPPKPPVQLPTQQLKTLLELLGPRICVALPWLRILFSTQIVFAVKSDTVVKKKVAVKETAASDINVSSSRTRDTATIEAPSDAYDYLKSLTAHHTIASKNLTNVVNVEIKNPLLYTNAYRHAPSMYTIQSHHEFFSELYCSP